jgi:hypothetical protein
MMVVLWYFSIYVHTWLIKIDDAECINGMKKAQSGDLRG